MQEDDLYLNLRLFKQEQEQKKQNLINMQIEAAKKEQIKTGKFEFKDDLRYNQGFDFSPF